jgi:hypothetical protein
VKVEAKGPRLRAWIEGILVADVEDHTHGSGRVGLATIQNPYPESPRFADFQIEGTPKPLARKLPLVRPEPHWITPCPVTDPETYQGYANLIRSRSGDATLFLTFGNPNYGETRRTVYIRSKDGGRTWGDAEPATLQLGFGGPFVRTDGTWVCVHPNLGIPKAPLYAYESPDDGRTWRGPFPLEIGGGWPAGWKTVTTWRAARMKSGALVLPIICQQVGDQEEASHFSFFTVMVIRSEDDGRTWTGPVLCDADNRYPEKPITESKYAGRSYEVAIDEGDEGTLVGIGRPDRDPYMWRLASADGGRSWEPAAIGHFPGYCPSITRTASGALVATVRFPHFAAYLSRDGGRTWGLPVIVDYCLWANQQAVEIEPDVVLVTYMGKIMDPGEADSRIARLKVTPTGLVLDQ